MKAKRVQKHGKKWILVQFERDGRISGLIKQISRSHWDEDLQGWLVYDIEKNHVILREIFGLSPKPPDATDREVKKFKEYLQGQRYSENTIKSYVDGLRIFLKAHPDKKPEDITAEDVNGFFRKHAYARNVSISWQLLIINAIKLYYARIENRKLHLEKLIRPKADKILPNVLSKSEVERILNNVSNMKHKAMLSLIYCCGLRRSELLNLKPEHINSDRLILSIKSAKGRKDRMAPLPERMIEMLREYYKEYRPKIYMFEGQTEGEPYGEKSLSEVLRKSIRRSGISKPVTLHWLRHSYATHLLESGTDIRYIQELLGHKSSKTTQIYTHVSTKKLSEIRSPFEDINLK